MGLFALITNRRAREIAETDRAKVADKTSLTADKEIPQAGRRQPRAARDLANRGQGPSNAAHCEILSQFLFYIGKEYKQNNNVDSY